MDGLAAAVWQGGEMEALARLDKHLERKVTLFHLVALPVC